MLTGECMDQGEYMDQWECNGSRKSTWYMDQGALKINVPISIWEKHTKMIDLYYLML